MWKKLQQFQAMLAAKNSGKMGDFALLKSDFLGAKVAPEVAEKLRSLAGYYPKIDLAQLSQYPPGSFGREYADHMQQHNLKPLTVSPELDEVAKRNVFALRYVITHDIFHVLLGFDTSYAGEMGVLAFAATQNYSNSLTNSLLIARLLYPIFAPQQAKAISAKEQKGRELGKKAALLLAYPFEDHWQEPINDVRTHLGLPQIIC